MFCFVNILPWYLDSADVRERQQFCVLNIEAPKKLAHSHRDY